MSSVLTTTNTSVVNESIKHLKTVTSDQLTQLKTVGTENRQNILLQRSNSLETNESVYRAAFDDLDDSDDEIEVVEAKTNQDMLGKVIRSGSEAQIGAMPHSSTIVINNKFINVITTNSSVHSSALTERVTTNTATQTSIKINPKYLKLFSNEVGTKRAPNIPLIQDNEYKKTETTKSTLRLNPKYSSTIAGSNPRDCGNIVNLNHAVNPKLLRNEVPTRKTTFRTSDDTSLSCSIGRRNLTLLPRNDPVMSPLNISEHLGEPLPNLWKFLCALLHNPSFNPKLIAWKEMERGEFRMNNLQEFYKVWQTLKKTEINYELWLKTLRIYDVKKILHSLEGFRCCYKFGAMAQDWKPFPHEILTSKNIDRTNTIKFTFSF